MQPAMLRARIRPAPGHYQRARLSPTTESLTHNTIICAQSSPEQGHSGPELRASLPAATPEPCAWCTRTHTCTRSTFLICGKVLGTVRTHTPPCTCSTFSICGNGLRCGPAAYVHYVHACAHQARTFSNWWQELQNRCQGSSKICS